MKVTLSIKGYISWVWIIERNRDIRKEYKKLSDMPDGFLPKFVFVDEEEFNEALKICGSDYPKAELNTINGKEIDIEWLDDFDYQAKIDMYQKHQ